MKRASNWIWGGFAFSLTLAILVTGMTIPNARGKARPALNQSMVEKNQRWPLASMMTMDPCRVRPCVTL